MGTNYYLKNSKPEIGEWSGIHIGKSSAGWCFALHVIPELNINSLEDWLFLFDIDKYQIENEYSDRISKEEMIENICNRSNDKPELPLYYKDWEEFLEQNHAEFGPSNLFRAKVDFGRLGRHGVCTSHGEGTFDLIIGEFS